MNGVDGAADAEARRTARLAAWRNRILDGLRERFEEEGNPLFAWEAVRVCNFADMPQHPIPEWCLSYLVTLSCRLWDLSELRDAKSRPWRDDDEMQGAFQVRLDAWEARHVTPTEALAQLSWVLDFSRQGWNAFKAYASEQRDEATAVFDMVERQRGQGNYVQRLASRWNVEPESVRKRLGRARRRKAGR